VTTETTYRQILFEKRGRVGLITLNRPERLNAFSYEMAGEFYDAIARCNDDPGVGAIVMTGAGRGFCSGADIRGFARGIEERAQAGDDQGRRYRGDPARREPLSTFFRKSKPLIAAINGPAIGVGLTMTLNMDIRIASDQARFSMRFVRLGITPEAGSTLYLPQIVGIAHALELSLTGRIIGPDEALRIGLVNRVVPQDDLMTEAMALADEIAFNPNEQVLAAKQMMHRHMVEQDVDHLLRYEGTTFARAAEGPAHKEAIRAFTEKREPKFNQA
jgi:2-(1,2-epoxy-1,2-dihydrophenyl)acetyl-CoA isomerase